MEGPPSEEEAPSADVRRLRALVAEGQLLHPLESASASFADLAAALALCCGAEADETPQARRLLAALGGEARQHIVLVLCDGLGTAVLEEHLGADGFLRAQNDAGRLRAVFPATTPAALTTLATARWPGAHGLPGWDLRDVKGCSFPGKPAGPVVQLRVLAAEEVDAASARGIADVGFSKADVYVAEPWAARAGGKRKVRYCSAYQGDGFSSWAECAECASRQRVGETAAATLGTPEGVDVALSSFREATTWVAEGLAVSDRMGEKTYTYVYTAHPDKHMHRLGVEAEEVREIVGGLSAAISDLWDQLRPLGDVALVVTADHGHVTVRPEDMVTLPPACIDCLEYANIGVHGKGRHGYFHCRAGRQKEFAAAWAADPTLQSQFLLMTPDEAAAEGLFGPDPMRRAVRPRLGDFVALAVGAATLVTPEEASKFRDAGISQGAHGSLTPEEMRIPFVLLTGKKRKDPCG